MKTLLSVTISLVLFIFVGGVLCLLGLNFFNSRILQCSESKALRVFVQMFMPPKGLYDYLVCENIDLAKVGETKEFKFRNKYRGKHRFGIALDKYSNKLYFKKNALKLKMSISFYEENKLLLSHIVDNNYYSIFGGRGSGFGFDIYNCPENLPTGKPITCRITILGSDLEMQNTYGPVKFYVCKESDE